MRLIVSAVEDVNFVHIAIPAEFQEVQVKNDGLTAQSKASMYCTRSLWRTLNGLLL